MSGSYCGAYRQPSCDEGQHRISIFWDPSSEYRFFDIYTFSRADVGAPWAIVSVEVFRLRFAYSHFLLSRLLEESVLFSRSHGTHRLFNLRQQLLFGIRNSLVINAMIFDVKETSVNSCGSDLLR